MSNIKTKEEIKQLLRNSKVIVTKEQNRKLQKFLRETGFQWINCTESDMYYQMPYIFIHENTVSFSSLKDVYNNINYKDFNIEDIFELTIKE